MAKYDGLLGQPVLEVEEPDKEGGQSQIQEFLDVRYIDIRGFEEPPTTSNTRYLKGG